MNNQTSKSNLNFGFYASLSTVILTVITFAIAIFTPPFAGPYCTANCYVYPYTDIASRFPRDYFWMYPAILLNIAYISLITAIHRSTSEDKKVYSQTGLFFASAAALVFILDFFVQLSIIQPSLVNGEFDGIALWSQFNPHGVFIVLEELGYLLMGFAFLFLAPVFSISKYEKSIRWIFALSGSLTIISFFIYSLIYGIFREYRFEVFSISVNWLTLIISGILLAKLFKRFSK